MYLIPAHIIMYIMHFSLSSVNHLADLLRQAVENEQKLMNEIILPGAKFHIREVGACITLNTP